MVCLMCRDDRVYSCAQVCGFIDRQGVVVMAVARPTAIRILVTDVRKVVK